MATLFFLGLFCVIAAVLILPLFLFLKAEKALGGPWLRVHLPLNLAFAAWAAYSLFFGQLNLHNPAPLLFYPASMALAFFYAFVFPRAAPQATASFRRFRAAASAAYLILILHFFVTLTAGQLTVRG